LRCGLGALAAAAAFACGDAPPPEQPAASGSEAAVRGPADGDARRPKRSPEEIRARRAEKRAMRAKERAEKGLDLAGRFRPARVPPDPADLSGEQRAMIRELEAIGYLSGSEQARGSGVTRHDPERSQPGLNFYASGHEEGALLIDMDGRVLHRWQFAFPDAFEKAPRPQLGKRDRWWRRAFLLPNGDVIALITGSGLLRLDKDSKLVWAKALYAHHDLAFEPNGDLWVMTRDVRIVPRVNAGQPIVEDTLTLLDSEGNEKRSLSLLEAFENSEFADYWLRTGRRSGDIFHSNSIERLDGRIADRNPAFREGNLLISFLEIDTIAVVDPEQQKVVWAHSGEYHRQHDPKILENGNLLLFDNRAEPDPSAVLEYDPASMEKVWEFRGAPEEPFFTGTCGTAERLANGNTLITETDFGRAFEVTADGTVVWEYYNPERAGDGNRFVASLPEMTRVPTGFVASWLSPALAEPIER
jgi:hypothetical protein